MTSSEPVTAPITIFAVPKAFRGHIGTIQQNAIRSWTRVGSNCEILLFGDDAGTAEAAAELGVRHEPDLARNEYGTPLVSDLFERVQRVATHDRLCYVNGDVVLTSELSHAVGRVADLARPVLLAGRRWRVALERPLDFQPGWEADLRQRAMATGWLDSVDCVDWFVFGRGLIGDLPDFALGRTRWDTWLLYRTRAAGALLIDATESVMAVHQEHGYGHPDGKAAVRRGPEAARNRRLAGGRRCTLGDARLKLTERGLERARDSVRLRWRIYSLRTSGLAGFPVRVLLLLLRRRGEEFLVSSGKVA